MQSVLFIWVDIHCIARLFYHWRPRQPYCLHCIPTAAFPDLIIAAFPDLIVAAFPDLMIAAFPGLMIAAFPDLVIAAFPDLIIAAFPDLIIAAFADLIVATRGMPSTSLLVSCKWCWYYCTNSIISLSCKRCLQERDSLSLSNSMASQQVCKELKGNITLAVKHQGTLRLPHNIRPAKMKHVCQDSGYLFSLARGGLELGGMTVLLSCSPNQKSLRIMLI